MVTEEGWIRMENSKQACAERILKAIDYGRLPGAEIEKRLWAMIDEALAGPAPSGSDSELAELCEGVTKEDVAAIARSVECDMIYFLTGTGEGAEEDEDDAE